MGNYFHNIIKAIYPKINFLWNIFNHLLPDSLYLKYQYFFKTGLKLNLKNPVLYNEKLQWLKLYNRRPEYTVMADKYEVRKFIAKTIGEEYLIPLFGVWNKFDEIPFNELPDQFVLKCTHDSGGVVICKDKHSLDIKNTRKLINKRLARNYYWPNREWVYKKIKPRIVVEKLLSDESCTDLQDYRFFCFNGEPLIIEIDDGHIKDEHAINFYSPYFEIQNLINKLPNAPQNKMPDLPTLDLMLNIARKLSAFLIHVRVDLYSVNNKVYFGELTFFDSGGYTFIFEPPEWNRLFGDWIKLPGVQ